MTQRNASAPTAGAPYASIIDDRTALRQSSFRFLAVFRFFDNTQAGDDIRVVTDDLQSLVSALAARLDRAVAIDDPKMRLICHTSHDGQQIDQFRVDSVLRKQVREDVLDYVMNSGIASANGPVRVPGVPDRGMLERVAVPIRCEGRLFGYLWLIDEDKTLTPDNLQVAAEAAGVAGQLLFREQLLGDLRHSRERDLLRDLLSAEAAIRTHAMDQLTSIDALPTKGSAVVLTIHIAEHILTDADAVNTELDLVLRNQVSLLAPLSAMAYTRAGGRGAMLIVAARMPSYDQLDRHAGRLCNALDTAFHGSGTARVGIGPTVRTLADAYLSHQRAEDALRVAAVVPGFGRVVHHERLGIYRLLANLPLDSLPPDAIPQGLRELIQKDRGGPLVDTLETYLDQAGAAQPTVDLLKIHRTSLYYRLRRIEEICASDLNDGGDRLSLHLGLKLARLTGLLPAATTRRSTQHGESASHE